MRHPLRRPMLLALLGSAALWVPALRPAPSQPPDPCRAWHLSQLGVARWHAAGFRGRGVKVAVLDSGFRGYQAHLGHALPEKVAVRSFRRDGNLEGCDSQHGILCGEVVHALAPDAELLLANWEPDQPDSFLEAVRWSRRQGARVLTCSVIMPAWSDGQGGGPVHAQLARLLGNGSQPGDALALVSAGNLAQRHWSGPFRDGGDGWHEWRPGRKDNPLSPYAGRTVALELAGSGGTFALQVLDRTEGVEVARTVPEPPGRGPVAVSLRPAAGHEYAVRVRRAAGAGGSFRLVALGGGLGEATAAGSIPFPGDGPEVLTVGAVDRQGRRFAYSSCGPNSRCPKPDLMAPVPFPSAWRVQPFHGTSAAAPQAAALAALCWGRHPDWTAGRVRQALGAASLDLGPPGHDWETGFGQVRLPGA